MPDGASNVFFAGEKYLDPLMYYTGTDGADNDTCLEGNDWDVNRWVFAGYPPMRDTKGVNDSSCGFGSAAPSGRAFCLLRRPRATDQLSDFLHRYQSLGVRNDGTPPDDQWN